MEVVDFETFGDLYKAVESGAKIKLGGSTLYITGGGILESGVQFHNEIYESFSNGCTFTKESPYSRYIGSLVKVRDGMGDDWVYDKLASVNLDQPLPYCVQDSTKWKYMEPLTEAEKNSIITKG